MKRIHAMAAALVASGAALAQAQVYTTHPGERVIIIETRPVSGAAIHSGATTVADEALADEVAFALSADRRLSEPGITSTVVANNGEVTITGSTDSFEQAQRAERLAKRAAGPAHVYAMISTTGG
jgi:osmotically-inducible protein OsmY